MRISPKVWFPTVAAIVAGLLLWLITGDKAALIVVLTGLGTGGAGFAAPHARGVRHRDVVKLAATRRHLRR